MPSDNIFEVDKSRDTSNRLIDNPDKMLKENELVDKCYDCREHFFKIVAEFSDDWIYWINPDSTLSYVSPSCKFITGYAAEEMTSEKSFFDKVIYLEDMEKFNDHLEIVSQGKSLCSEIFRIIDKAGNTRWISHYCQAVYDENDRYLGRYVCNKDITELSNTNNFMILNDGLFQIYENVTIGYYQVYLDGKLRNANKALLNMLGYESADIFTDRNFEENCVLNIEKRENFKRSILKYGRIKDFESAWIKRDLNIIYLRETASLVKNANGTKPYIEVIVHDITEERKTEQAYKEASEQKRKSEELKTEFLATISHEIRTPLNVILNLTHGLIEDAGTQSSVDPDERLNIIDEEGKRIQRTIDLILEMSELQTGTYDYNITEVNFIEDVFNQLFEQYRNKAEKKHLEFVLTDNLLERKIFADKHSIYQIFNQLIDNAIKYTNSGKVEVVLYQDDKKHTTVEISDTGIGIKEEFLPHLFSVFSQENNSYSRVFEGTGLGLAIVKKHCDLNNAVIEVESKKNVGTKFKVVFG